MMYSYFGTISTTQYERLCDELSETTEENKRLEIENASLKLENERLHEKFDKFNKALDGMRG